MRFLFFFLFSTIAFLFALWQWEEKNEREAVSLEQKASHATSEDHLSDYAVNTFDRLLADVEENLQDKQREQALQLLRSCTFKDQQEVGRLLRVALLSRDSDPLESWRQLCLACEKCGNTYETHVWKGRFLESIGQYTRAYEQYKMAMELAPKNPYLYDYMAAFYLRRADALGAQEVCRQYLSDLMPEPLLVKILFLNRVVKPQVADQLIASSLSREEAPLALYLHNLNSDAFWDYDQFMALDDSSSYLERYQETYWLMLLQSLKENDLQRALKLMRGANFPDGSWFPELELHLQRVISYRQKQTLNYQLLVHSEVRVSGGSTPLMAKIAEWANLENEQGSLALPEECRHCLEDEQLFSKLFAEAGWGGAARLLVRSG